MRQWEKVKFRVHNNQRTYSTSTAFTRDTCHPQILQVEAVTNTASGSSKSPSLNETPVLDAMKRVEVCNNRDWSCGLCNDTLDQLLLRFDMFPVGY